MKDIWTTKGSKYGSGTNVITHNGFWIIAVCHNPTQEKDAEAIAHGLNKIGYRPDGYFDDDPKETIPDGISPEVDRSAIAGVVICIIGILAIVAYGIIKSLLK